MRRTLLSAFLAFLLLGSAAYADEMAKPDDHVTLTLAAEDWVTTKTARVTVNVEAAVSGANAGTMRADMAKAVNGLAAADWRLVSFDRSQDLTGMERWSAGFEARLPEAALGGLGDTAKKLSKPGMQLSAGEIDFSPTLDEVEAVRSALRVQLYKQAADQLTALNTALPGRNYRIAEVDFNGGGLPRPPHPVMRNGAMAPVALSAAASTNSDASDGEERSQKITMTARIIFAALPAMPDAKH